MKDAMHGTAVEIHGWSVLLTGDSGSGKSDLALRLLDRGATLVGDDYVRLSDAGDALLVHPVESLKGKMEIRGIGIVEQQFRSESPLRLIVRLGAEGERHPVTWPLCDLRGWAVPILRLDGLASSAPIKIERALQSVVDGDLFPVRLIPGL